MGNVGHSRAFAAFTASGVIGLLAHMLLIDPIAWAMMRIASGLCVAGCYTVVEAWLQAKVTNENAWAHYGRLQSGRHGRISSGPVNDRNTGTSQLCQL